MGIHAIKMVQFFQYFFFLSGKWKEGGGINKRKKKKLLALIKDSISLSSINWLIIEQRAFKCIGPSPDMQRRATGKTGIVNPVKASFFLFWSVSLNVPRCAMGCTGFSSFRPPWYCGRYRHTPPFQFVAVVSLKLCTEFTLSVSKGVMAKIKTKIY